MNRLAFALVLVLTCGSAFAQSTINPALPANGLPYSSSVIRGQFDNAYNDINAIRTLGFSAQVPTLAALQVAATSTFPSGVWRVCYTAAICADPLFYSVQTGTCAANGLVNDGGNCVNAFGANSWLARWPPSGMDVRQFGAHSSVSNNSTPLQTARDAAIAAKLPLRIPPLTLPVSDTINFGAATVEGITPLQPAFPASGAEIQCPVAIAAPCVTFGTTSPLIGGVARDVIVSYLGTPVAGDVGIIFKGYNIACSDILVHNAYDGIQFGTPSPPDPLSIAAHCDKIYTYNVLHNHTVMSSMPEVYITNCRLGSNGVSETSNAYIGMTGNDPNTIVFDACQFNVGGGGVSFLIDAYGLTNNDNGLWKIANSHVELATVGVIRGDSTAACKRCMFVNNDIYHSAGLEMFVGMDSSGIQESVFNGNNFYVDSLTFPDVIHQGVRFVNNFVFGNVTVRGGGNLIIDGLQYGGAIQLNGASWNTLRLSNFDGAGFAADTATGKVFGSNMPRTAWTPQLLFGGAHVGMTSTQQGDWWRNPDGTKSASFGVLLSAKGASTGTATIVAPFTCAADGFGGVGNKSLLTTGNIVGTTVPPTVTIVQGSATINFANNATLLDDTNFANNTAVSGVVTCFPP